MAENSSNALRRQLMEMRQSLFSEGDVDDQFLRLEMMQQRSNNPNFMANVVNAYFRDSVYLLEAVRQQMRTDFIYFPAAAANLTDLRFISTSVAAIKVIAEINKAIEFAQARNMDGLKVAFRQVQEEHAAFRAKLEAYFELLRQVRGAIPPQ